MGTDDLKVMVLDIDRCQNKIGEAPTCAEEKELDIWLADHQFNLYSLENKINLDLMNERPADF